MSKDKIILKWKRPETVDYPKVWHRFMARDLNSDELVEYRIEDVTQSNAEDVLKHMKSFYLRDEPAGIAIGGHENDEDYYEDYKRGWIAAIEQKVPLVCYRAGSNEIVGVNMNFVMSKEDRLMERFMNVFKSNVTKNVFGLLNTMYDDFNPFEYYNVDKFMASFGLSVDSKYRGRNIGDHFLATRKLFGKEFGMKLTHTMFSSDFSNGNADRVGFEPNVVINYEDVAKTHPEYAWAKNIKSRAMTLKSWIF